MSVENYFGILYQIPRGGGGGALTYNGSIDPPFHALPAVPKHIFFIDQPVPKAKVRSWNPLVLWFLSLVLYPRK